MVETKTMSEKKPRLFYYEEAEECWAPVADLLENIVSIESFTYDGQTIELQFKRIDMTDDEFDNLEEN